MRSVTAQLLIAVLLTMCVAVCWAQPAMAQSASEDAENGASDRSRPFRLPFRRSDDGSRSLFQRGDQADLPPEPRRSETEQAIITLNEVLAAKTQAESDARRLARELRRAGDDATKAELEQKRQEALKRIKDLESQVAALTAGVSDREFAASGAETFNLNKEVENLLRPFVSMLKSATETARQIETLRSTIASSERRIGVAESALARLDRILADPAAEGREAAQVRQVLAEQKEAWDKRLTELRTLRDTSLQQLQVKLTAQSNAQDGFGGFVARFIQTRGFNLLIGLAVFFGVFGLMRIIARVAAFIQRRRGIPRTFATRLITLVFQAFSLVAATLAMLSVFNLLSDWLLLGFSAIIVVALAWLGLKMIPQIVEQVTLLLNLGAVQEGERVMINGVPWRVEKLDYYTDLVNPALDGGTFTVPVRELSGLHSRPPAQNEAWFPTLTGDWIQLADGRLAQVRTQTPELVQIIELGGAQVTVATSAFIEQAPRNLSHGFRVEVPFGVDYRHQAIATDEIPRILRQSVSDGLLTFIGENAMRGVAVEVLRAGESSIDYEVEADFTGDVAARYEEIEREMARLLIAACNRHGWVIPFPQLVMHRGLPNGAGGAAAVPNGRRLAQQNDTQTGLPTDAPAWHAGAAMANPMANLSDGSSQANGGTHTHQGLTPRPGIAGRIVELPRPSRPRQLS